MSPMIDRISSCVGGNVIESPGLSLKFGTPRLIWKLGSISNSPNVIIAEACINKLLILHALLTRCL